MTMYELCRRRVIDMASGTDLGRVDDIAFEEATAAITHIILYGKPKLFGLLGREEDMAISWTAIRKIGQDVLLVEAGDLPARKPGRKLPFLKGAAT